jgi:small-conductance mechanosensitive channel
MSTPNKLDPRWTRFDPTRSIPAARDALRAIDARAKPDLKRAVPAVLITLFSFTAGVRLGGIDRHAPARFGVLGKGVDVSSGAVTIIVIGLTLAFVLAGVVATRSAGRELARVGESYGGISAGAAVRVICFIVGYGNIGLGLLALLRVNVGNLLVGGAVTGVILGIAAQQTLGNFFAGLVLLFARPYVPGQLVRVHSGAMDGPFEGVIVHAGLMYTTIRTEEGNVSMPNSGLLGAALSTLPQPDNASLLKGPRTNRSAR